MEKAVVWWWSGCMSSGEDANGYQPSIRQLVFCTMDSTDVVAIMDKTCITYV